MSKKKGNGNKQQNKKRRSRGGGGGGKDSVLKDLAIMQIVPDMMMPLPALKMARDLAQLQLPGRPGVGPLNGHIEIFTTMMIASGCHPDDASEIIKMVSGTGQAMPWLDVPDFDSAKENRAEKKYAQAMGGDYLDMYTAATKLRKKLSKAAGKDDKKLAKWHAQWGQ